MAIDIGLPAVPRGQSREMTAYLQSLHNVILGMSGLGRGTAATQVVRVSDRSRNSSGTGNAQGSGKLAAGSVQTIHLADQAVTAQKLALGAVESANIATGAVDNAALGDKSVSMEKLSQDALPVFEHGEARHGETVNLGKWAFEPLVIINGQNIPIGICGELRVGIDNLREEAGEWKFEVSAAFEMDDEDGEAFYPGSLTWLAVGWRRL